MGYAHKFTETSTVNTASPTFMVATHTLTHAHICGSISAIRPQWDVASHGVTLGMQSLSSRIRIVFPRWQPLVWKHTERKYIDEIHRSKEQEVYCRHLRLLLQSPLFLQGRRFSWRFFPGKTRMRCSDATEMSQCLTRKWVLRVTDITGDSIRDHAPVPAISSFAKGNTITRSRSMTRSQTAIACWKPVVHFFPK